MSKEKIEMIKEQWQESNTKFYKRNGNKNQEMMGMGEMEALVGNDLQNIMLFLYRMI
jgi:hypothetical protein